MRLVLLLQTALRSTLSTLRRTLSTAPCLPAPLPLQSGVLVHRLRPSPSNPTPATPTRALPSPAWVADLPLRASGLVKPHWSEPFSRPNSSPSATREETKEQSGLTYYTSRCDSPMAMTIATAGITSPLITLPARPCMSRRLQTRAHGRVRCGSSPTTNAGRHHDLMMPRMGYPLSAVRPSHQIGTSR